MRSHWTYVWLGITMKWGRVHRIERHHFLGTESIQFTTEPNLVNPMQNLMKMPFRTWVQRDYFPVLQEGHIPLLKLWHSYQIWGGFQMHSLAWMRKDTPLYISFVFISLQTGASYIPQLKRIGSQVTNTRAVSNEIMFSMQWVLSLVCLIYLHYKKT